MTFTISAEETRQVDKHEHGVGELNIAVEGSTIEFEFMIPGADIVGFEYVAKSDEDIAKINQALKTFDDMEAEPLPPGSPVSPNESLADEKPDCTMHELELSMFPKIDPVQRQSVKKHDPSAT